MKFYTVFSSKYTYIVYTRALSDMYAGIYVCMYISMYVYVICTCNMYVPMYMYVCMYVCMYVWAVKNTHTTCTLVANS